MAQRQYLRGSIKMFELQELPSSCQAVIRCPQDYHANSQI